MDNAIKHTLTKSLDTAPPQRGRMKTLARKACGTAFLFFLAKGMVWLVVFAGLMNPFLQG